MKLNIHPSVGVARLGNSPDQFYLAPDSIGGLPYESDPSGNKLGSVVQFKDSSGRVRQQGQPFSIFDENENEITLQTPYVQSIEWTVHLANKKAAWYQYSELEGNLLFGQENSYASRNVPFRNPDKTGDDRKALIIDPGPRTVSGAGVSVTFTEDSVPAGYPATFPPQTVQYGTPILSLGKLLTDGDGRLIVLGGAGNAGGDEPLTSYGGSNTWHDDISDGPVYCTISFNNGEPPVTVQAWVIVGSPDYAPEIVNISALSDTMLDVGIRNFNLMPDVFSNNQWNREFEANFHRDILPVMRRMANYQWVANVQPMMAMTTTIFDFTDNSDTNMANRMKYLSYFRPPNQINDASPFQPSGKLFLGDGVDIFPMMPLNSGSNSVSNENVVKFLSLNDTQYFFMVQWARGKFCNSPDFEPYPVHQADLASVGNCVGLPMCPGIEVTWSLQNPAIYAAPFLIADEKGMNGYNQTGLDPSRDECEGGGCQPGDLTKRMACPWQADFFQCTIQYINFTVPETNKESKQPLPPTYYAYWWPPQSPWDVLVGDMTREEQAYADFNVPMGQQMNYARGINSFVQMVEHWSALAFIRNRNSGSFGYPYFTETERTNELFRFEELPIGKVTGNSQDNETTLPVYYIEPDNQAIRAKGVKGRLLAASLEERAFKAIEIAPQGLEMPRSGTRTRR